MESSSHFSFQLFLYRLIWYREPPEVKLISYSYSFYRMGHSLSEGEAIVISCKGRLPKLETKTHIGSGVFMSVRHGEIDLVILYRILKIAYEKPGISLTELFRQYRERTGIKVNYTIIKRHIEYARDKGLLDVKGEKPASVFVTKKGVDYMFLISNIANLLGEEIA